MDDYPTNLDVASGMLKKYKMQVDCVNSGQKAIDLVNEHGVHYDAIFMDHMMPEMDGIEATQIIRSIENDYAKTVPIISLTANALTGNEQMFLDKGFNDFLSKPISILKLDAIVKKYIRHNSTVPSQEAIPESPSPVGTSSYGFRQALAGVNFSVITDLYGGEKDIFIFSLESFIENIPEAIQKMRIVNKENLHEYAIDVHALKSMAAAIGAEALSERAKHLEGASKAGLLEEVLSLNDSLLDDTASMAETIKEWLKQEA